MWKEYWGVGTPPKSGVRGRGGYCNKQRLEAAPRLRSRGSYCLTSGLVKRYDTRRGSTPNFFMRAIKVVRLSPMRAAAPSGPATRPLVVFKTRTISSRSFDSRVPAIGVVFPLLVRPEIGTCSSVPWVRITERSMKFSSSRMFPGQCQLESFFMAWVGTDSIFLFIRRAYFCAK